ncbi:MT-A70-domain-containing protein [Gongronella butleri]|nr:MT-A70-domain-containing protein [Gongronella butleri]
MSSRKRQRARPVDSPEPTDNMYFISDQDIKALLLRKAELQALEARQQAKVDRLTVKAKKHFVNARNRARAKQPLLSTKAKLGKLQLQSKAKAKQRSKSDRSTDSGQPTYETEHGDVNLTKEELKEYEAPEWCVPIKANVMTFEWEKLANEVQFDVIVADPPWQLATHAPTRGVAIAYQQLPDICIEDLPIPKLQKNGLIFIWVINNKYVKAFELMEKWGYTYVDDITWVKQTVNRRMAKGHGYYLQHAKETCLVGKKGDDPPNFRHSVGSDVIFSERRGQSQKPEELYELIEELVPGGKYLEIFGRKNNLRDYWVTIGNEL